MHLMVRALRLDIQGVVVFSTDSGKIKSQMGLSFLEFPVTITMAWHFFKIAKPRLATNDKSVMIVQ
jgi:hypothetical protein